MNTGLVPYEVLLEVGPPRAFGLPDLGYMVSATTTPTMNFDFGQGKAWATREDGRDGHRTETEVFSCDFRVNGVRIVGKDNYFRVQVSAKNPDEAVGLSKRQLLQVLHLAQTKLPEPDFAYYANAVRVTVGNRNLRKQPEMSGGLFVFDNDALRADITWAALTLEGKGADERLNQALRHLTMGDELLKLNTQWDEEEHLSDITPLRFLQYWKAITTIIGDPSKDSGTHQSKPKTLGLGRQFFRHRVQKMTDLRNKFGVAHVADPEMPRIVSPEQTAECRSVAVTVIQAYINTERSQVS